MNSGASKRRRWFAMVAGVLTLGSAVGYEQHAVALTGGRSIVIQSAVTFVGFELRPIHDVGNHPRDVIGTMYDRWHVYGLLHFQHNEDRHGASTP